MAFHDDRIYPIIYIRGYGMTEAEIRDTAADPYMGFNLGSTRVRPAHWDGSDNRHFFESPLVRLIKDYGYIDAYREGYDLINSPNADPLPQKSIIIYRYYDRPDVPIGEQAQPIPYFAYNLMRLIENLRNKICETPAERDNFKVYLVAHSMGGLIVRSFLQNDKIIGYAPDGPEQTLTILGDTLTKSRQAVAKVFTYGTPHNGIDIFGFNVPKWFGLFDISNFNRRQIASDLSLTPDADGNVNSLDGKFPADRFFTLVGTNARDYAAAAGTARVAAGDYSDGLVAINNAVLTTPDVTQPSGKQLSPRAYVNRSHSGPFGLVNSEEGYQNLIRFLFGKIRVEGFLAVTTLDLPAQIAALKDDGQEVRASYAFETILTVRGALWHLNRRVASENSTIFRKYNELFPDSAQQAEEIIRQGHAKPQLFSLFLDPTKTTKENEGTVSFSITLGIFATEYIVSKKIRLDEHYEGSYLYQDQIIFKAETAGAASPESISTISAWTLRYRFASSQTADWTVAVPESEEDGAGYRYRIPIRRSAPQAVTATLLLNVSPW